MSKKTKNNKKVLEDNMEPDKLELSADRIEDIQKRIDVVIEDLKHLDLSPHDTTLCHIAADIIQEAQFLLVNLNNSEDV